MKDIDEQVRRAGEHKPRRELSPNFTAQVVTELKARQTAPRKDNLIMKLFHKPVLASFLALAIVGLLGGTSYAATNGFTKPFNLRNIFSFNEEYRKDDTRIITVRTKDCKVVKTPTINNRSASSDRTMYFKTTSSSLPTENVLRYVQGYCETKRMPDIYNDIFPQVVKMNHSLNMNNGTESNISFDAGEVVESNSAKIVLRGKVGEATTENQDFIRMSYSNYSSDMVVRSQNRELKLNDIKKGSYAILVYRTKGVTSSINAGAKFEKPSDVDSRVALYIYSMSSNATYYNHDSESVKKRVERVKPCSIGSTEYCAWNGEEKSSPAELSREQKKAKSFVKEVYEKYNSHSLTEGPDYYQNAKDEIEPYLTKDLANEVLQPKTYDPVVCVQNGPVYLSYGTPVKHDNLYIVPVYGSYDKTNAKSNLLLSEVSFSPSKQLITSIDCSF